MSQSYLKVQLDAKKYSLLTAQLSALQYQLNPHFLFNTLQSIDLEILKATRHPTNANRMISGLSELLRYSLKAPDLSATVREEIDATNNYIELQNLRSGEPFQVIWSCENRLLEYHLPRLLLQPIVENSIIHSSLPDPQKLKIKICFRLLPNGLAITVTDNGLGMDPNRLQTLRKNMANDPVETQGRHIGLINISQRIQLAYKEGSVNVWSKQGLGTVVSIRGIQDYD